MFLVDDVVVYGASDLAAAARCEYALLRSFDHKLGRGPAPECADDEMLARTAELGDAHEQRRLDELVHEHGDGVVRMGRPAYTIPALTAAAAATMRAVEGGAAAVYQAAMFDGRMLGFADFVVRDPDGRYRVSDTKLARSAKVEALLQLAAYADMLTRAGVFVAPEAELLLGDRSVVRYPIDELLPVYVKQRDRLQSLLDRHVAGGTPVSWSDETVNACLRCADCQVQIAATDDLLLVARMRASHRARLLAAGVSTITDLAGFTGTVPDMPARTLSGLVAQAQIQVRQRDSGAPQFEIADPQALSLLPHPDDGDLFFDFEGDPMWTDAADRADTDWGLEYLFGVLEHSGRFRPLWAHDRAAERRALVDFLAFVRKRRKRYPNMHVYHYAAYEKSALLRLAGRYGTGEDDVDDLLRAGVLVDLYPLVRKSIRVGTHSYGLKALEPLYMGAHLRDGDVTTAAGSITAYVNYCRLRDAGRSEDAAAALKQIEEYNHYDCVSTRGLRDWLLLRAFEAGVTPLGAQPAPGRTTKAVPALPAADDTDRVGVALARFAGDDRAGRSADQTAVALLAAARGFHTRENKPFWWAHFDRINYPIDEWADTAGVFVVDGSEVVDDWAIPPRARKPRRQLRLTGTLAGGVLEHSVFALYDPPVPPSRIKTDEDHRGWGDAEIVATVESGGVPVSVDVCERVGADGDEFTAVPVALTPGSPVPTGSLESAIESVAEATADALAQRPQRLADTAIHDILRRRPPRTRVDAALPQTGDYAADITAALLSLDRSYLAVHGPPGTGKTHTAAHVVSRLVVDHGWRIGVVAQSHAVVENLLDCVVNVGEAIGLDPARVAKKSSRDVGGAKWQRIPDSRYAAFIGAASGCVIGGTAWDFANAGRVPPGSLDLLVVDEAGQFSLANTIAVSVAAANLLLLGDPAQLPQVSAGTHPEPVDTSALGWLVDGRSTLPAELGYFLARSYRMHPAVCAPVSALSYGGRLRSVEQAAARRLDGQAPGVRTLSVAHEGNATSSGEEAAAIVAEIGRLLGATWTDEKGSRPLTQADVLVVAPYNAQVLRVRAELRAAGLDDVGVGTVDKFQGRQAPVVFVSMTASSIDDVPRGIAFLLNRNRLNVAISRALYSAVIVASPALTEYLPGTPERLVELGAFLRLTAGERTAR